MDLQYAVSIRNCYLYAKGFTPAQIAICQNSRLASTSNDKLPALEVYSTSPAISRTLKCNCQSRGFFIRAVNKAKLSKTLKHFLCSHCSQIFKQGDKLFYKLPQDGKASLSYWC